MLDLRDLRAAAPRSQWEHSGIPTSERKKKDHQTGERVHKLEDARHGPALELGDASEVMKSTTGSSK